MWGGTHCYSEALVPKTIQFENEVKEDAHGKQCHYVLLVLNLPAPETVNFHPLIMRPKSHDRLIDPMLAGLSIDVGELKFFGGKPAGVNKVNLASAAFISPTFNSLGRLNTAPFGDRGLLSTTTDMSTGREFIQAFLKGGYEISFMRDEVSGARSYRISASPPGEVVRQFQACLNTLL
jgi:hypothetical protein